MCERNIGRCLAQVICIACIQEGDGFLWYQFVIPTTVYINLNTSVFGPFQLTLKLLVLFLPLQSVWENKHMDDEFARVHISRPLCWHFVCDILDGMLVYGLLTMMVACGYRILIQNLQLRLWPPLNHNLLMYIITLLDFLKVCGFLTNV